MGGNETDSEEINGAASDPGDKPPRGCVTALTTILTVLTLIIGVSVKFSVLGPHVLAGTAHCLLALAAFGWIIRAAIRARIGYFHRIEIEGVSAWALPLSSFADAAFGLAWLGGAILLLVRAAGPLPTAVATAIICVISFVLALATHRAARAAERPRASEWVRDRYRGPLEPGKTTWIGWLLVKVIDRRSPEELLSTYVSGSMGTLLLVIILIASAALSEDRKKEAQPKSPPSVASHSETSKKAPKPGGVTQAHSPEVLATLASGMPTNTSTHKVDTTGRAIHLFCFPVEATAYPAPPRPPTERITFFCIIVAKGGLTNQFLVLVPSPKH
jgi:hypothetical protein